MGEFPRRTLAEREESKIEFVTSIRPEKQPTAHHVLGKRFSPLRTAHERAATAGTLVRTDCKTKGHQNFRQADTVLALI
jgi:hypothetical protein